jgi:hypothetical protein
MFLPNIGDRAKKAILQPSLLFSKVFTINVTHDKIKHTVPKV